MARVEGGRALFRAQIVRILRKRRAGKVEIDSVRGSINRFPPSVSGKPGKSMELREAHGSLQHMVRRICASGENINRSPLRVREVLVLVIQAGQLGALRSHITNFKRETFSKLLLHIQAPALHIGSAEIQIGNEN